MSLFAVLSAIIVVAALASFVNHRFIGLPTTVGVLLIAVAMSIALLAASWLGLPVRALALEILGRVRFSAVVLDDMLALLLFAGALNVDVAELRGQKLSVGILATRPHAIAKATREFNSVGSHGAWVIGCGPRQNRRRGRVDVPGRRLHLGGRARVRPRPRPRRVRALFGALISPTDPGDDVRGGRVLGRGAGADVRSVPAGAPAALTPSKPKSWLQSAWGAGRRPCVLQGFWAFWRFRRLPGRARPLAPVR